MPSSAAQGARPFAAQLKFFRDKVSLPTRAWTDLIESEHDIGFMVAGAGQMDLVEDLRGAVDRVISEGRTLEDFRKDFDDIVARRGWDFKGGRNWRTRVIYTTNLRQSYHAGRETQMADPALRQRRPFGLYRHGGSDDPRPEHLALDGTVLPLDDPFWEVWTPQNGWGCSCKKFMVSAKDAERLGLDVRDQAPAGSLDTETVTVGATGPSPREVRVPKGIDPGFATRPGALHTAQGAMQIYNRMGTGLAPAAAVKFHAAVRERALRQVMKEWDGWLAAARAGSPQAAGTPAAIGMLRPGELTALEARGLSPARTDISIDALGAWPTTRGRRPRNGPRCPACWMSARPRFWILKPAGCCTCCPAPARIAWCCARISIPTR